MNLALYKFCAIEFMNMFVRQAFLAAYLNSRVTVVFQQLVPETEGTVPNLAVMG